MATNGLQQRIWLVAHDFSPRAEAAMTLAVDELCELPGAARIVLLHVVQPAPAAAGELSTLSVAFGKLEHQAVDEAMQRLEAIAHSASAHAKARERQLMVECTIRIGRAADCILEEAETGSVERIIVGTHGRRGLGRLVMGSVAELVVRKAHVPVLVAHDAARGHHNLSPATPGDSP